MVTAMLSLPLSRLVYWLLSAFTADPPVNSLWSVPTAALTKLLWPPRGTAVRTVSALEVAPVPIALRADRPSASSRCCICSAAPPSVRLPPTTNVEPRTGGTSSRGEAVHICALLGEGQTHRHHATIFAQRNSAAPPNREAVNRVGQCFSVEADGASREALARPGFHRHARAWSRRTA